MSFKFNLPQAKRTVKVELPGIGERLISNVWYVPTFKKNLLSLVVICQLGNQIVMEDGILLVNSKKDAYKTVMTCYEDEKLLRMKGTVIPRSKEHLKEFAGLVETNVSPIKLWHIRSGHLNVDSLVQLQQQGMVKGLPTFQKENAKREA